MSVVRARFVFRCSSGDSSGEWNRPTLLGGIEVSESWTMFGMGSAETDGSGSAETTVEGVPPNDDGCRL